MGLCLKILEFNKLLRIVCLDPILDVCQLWFKVRSPLVHSNGAIFGRCGY